MADARERPVAAPAPDHVTLDVPDGPPPRVSPRRARGAILAIGAAALIVAGFGIATRVHSRNTLEDDTKKTAAPIVSVFEPERGAPLQEFLLPGTAQAFTDAPIYARTNGYLKKWYADIGARVRKGQLLAEIDSPEIEQQLQQAKADLASAEANEQLARVTGDRYSELAKTDSVSKQEADNAAGSLAARHAATESSRANVRRLQQMVGFEKIEAPFDGVITARNANIGQLVDAGSGGSGRELFHIATLDRLRVFVGVPQTGSAAATPGLPVDVDLAERPGVRLPGKIVRNSNAIDPATRTMLVEIDLENRDGTILPGASVQVHLKLAGGAPTLLLPVSALMFRSEGPRVATVVQGNRAALIPVTIGRDYGNRVEVTSGLAPGALVIDSPPDSLIDGTVLQVSRPDSRKAVGRRR
ncbi:MAG: efflux RND transporter periplasmic adaptor subunit [Acidobacteriota bacterium]|nr:efflux RND transporter periplasmic adaptor subunit [Acidobacteriota bacterium]